MSSPTEGVDPVTVAELPTLEIPPTGGHNGTVIFLHVSLKQVLQ